MKVVTVFLKYDYGIKERGESLEKKLFLPAIENSSEQVFPFWLEENGYPDNLETLQEKIVSFCESKNPDIIFFILMESEVTKSTLKYLSDRFVTINWFADDQWRFDSFTKHVAPLLTHSITVDKYSIPKYLSIGCKAILSQWACMEYLEKINFDDIDYIYDISFIGSKNISREWYIYELEKSGYNVECFGSGWKNGRISQDKMKEIFKSSKININLSNSIPTDLRFYKYIFKRIFFIDKGENIISYLKRIKHHIGLFLGRNRKNVEQIKARNFEIPGFGGFQLSQYAPEIEDYYIIGSEIAIFTSIDELKLNIEYYLNSDCERKKLCINGYKKTANYTYNKRIKDVFKVVNK